ncbi:MAG: TonB-dependent receptor [Methylococcales bacterium]|nr:TonB-dependent receptor [Methylococcales bacterium]
MDRGLFAIGNRPAPIPVTRSFIDPNDPVDTNSKVNLGFNLRHDFNDNWTLRNRFLASFIYDKSSYYANALATPSDGGANHYIFRDNWYGAYFQDHITLWEKVHILGGGRYDWATTGVGTGTNFNSAEAALPSRPVMPAWTRLPAMLTNSAMPV